MAQGVMAQGVKADGAGGAAALFLAASSGKVRMSNASQGAGFDGYLKQSGLNGTSSTKASERSQNAAQESGAGGKQAEPSVQAKPGAQMADAADAAGRAGAADQAGAGQEAVDAAGQAQGTPAEEAGTGELTEEEMAAAMEALNGWLAQIAGKLEVPVEKLQDFLAQNGMTAADLLDGKNLAMLVAGMNGLEGANGLLMDEAAFAQWQELAGKLDELLAGGELPAEPQELMEAFQEAMGQMDNAGEATGQQGVQAEAAGEPLDMAQPEQAPVEAPEETGEQDGTRDGQEAVREERHSGSARQQGENPATVGANTFMNRLGEAMGRAQEAAGGSAMPEQTAEILNQVVRGIRTMMGPDSAAMEMALHPENLGRVNISVALKNGIMTAQLTVQNEDAKQALEGQMAALQQTFEEQGLKVQSVEVDISDFAFGESNGSGEAEGDGGGKEPSKQGRRVRTLEELMAREEEWDEEDELAASRMVLTGSQVDYSA